MNEFKLTVEINAPEIAGAIARLADVLLTTMNQGAAVNRQAAAIPEKQQSDKAVGDALVAKVIAETKAKRAAEKAAQEQQAVEEKVVVDPEAEMTEAAEAPEEDAPQYSFEEMRKAMGDLSKSKGSAVAKKILADIGQKCVTDIPKESYAEVMATIKGLN